MTANDYIYATLRPPQASSFEIRVVTLFGSAQNDEVHVEISTQLIRQYGSHKVEYEALSYTWGNPEDPEDIVVRTGDNAAVRDEMESSNAITRPAFSIAKLSVTRNLH